MIYFATSFLRRFSVKKSQKKAKITDFNAYVFKAAVNRWSWLGIIALGPNVIEVKN